MASSNENEALHAELQAAAMGSGASHFGVADLTQGKEALAGAAYDLSQELPRAICVGIPLVDRIVDHLARHKEAWVARTYDRLYDTVNARLDAIALTMAHVLHAHGASSLMIPASDTVDKERFLGLFPHKLAARLAGLGWIGPSCLLVTPEYGPRVRLATVLTEAPLLTGSIMEDRCGDCLACVEACPVQALSGRRFDPLETREARFTPKRCARYRDRLRDTVSGARVCGLCVAVCPFGRKRASFGRTPSSPTAFSEQLSGA